MRWTAYRIFSDFDLNYILATTKLEKHEITVVRDGEKMEIPHVVFHNNMEGGGMIDFGLVYKNKNPLTVLGCSKDYFCSMSHLVGLSLKQLFSGDVKKEEVSGPVGVVMLSAMRLRRVRRSGCYLQSALYVIAHHYKCRYIQSAADTCPDLTAAVCFSALSNLFAASL